MLASKILQPQQITFEVGLIVKVNVENNKNRHSAAADIQLADKWHKKREHPGRSRDRPELIPPQIQLRDAHRASAPWCWESRCPPGNQRSLDGPRVPSRQRERFRQFVSSSIFRAETRYVFPGERHQHAQTASSTAIQKPAWRRMVNPHNIQASLAHEREVKIDLLRPAKVVPFGIRLEGP